jgi:hypothetical protein
LTQAKAAAAAGISRGEWSGLELGKRDATLWIVNRAAHAVGGKLRAYVEETSAATLPKDAVHLRNQELVLRTAAPGAWRGQPEATIDRDAGRSRHADVLLERRGTAGPGATEYALFEVIDWFEDVGAPTRDWARRLDAVEKRAIARMVGEEFVPRISGCWLVRATRRNRQLVSEHRHFFRARFPGSGRAWLAALTDTATAMPAQPALLWVDVGGTRIFAARLGSG